MTTNTKAQQLLDFDMIDDDSYQIDGCDDAIIGAVDQRVVYSYTLLVESVYRNYMQTPLAKKHYEGQDDEHALLMSQEWVEFNCMNQCNIHNNKTKTPIIIYTI